ncbi:serine hydrolase domain-containing protein [Larkinella sp. VNQ87]|uniref:serine hydrolase domain-containing protein n=1 Tax=Larkinella sp. VNQ87 TaxID=3400921 RepID=UPI003BFC5A2A
MKKNKWFVLLAVLAMAGCTQEDGTPVDDLSTNNPLQSEQDKTIDARLRPYFRQKVHVGALVGVYRQGTVSWYEYGETAKGSGQRPGANTLFEIGSITKPITAALVIDWLQQNQLTLDTPVAAYLPAEARSGASKNNKPMTFRHLLDYSSGLPEDGTLAPDLISAPGYNPANPFQHFDSTQVYNYLKNRGLTNTPGTTYSYSNLAFGLAGILLERNTRQTYETLVRERITGPLQMNDTGITLSAEQEKRMAQGYDASGKTVARWKNLGGFAAAGILVSSGTDLMKFGQAHLRGDSPLEKILAPTRQVSFVSATDGRQGLGWVLTDPEFDGVLKSGGTGGFSSLLVTSKTKQMVIIMLVNNKDDSAVQTFGLLAADLLKL